MSAAASATIVDYGMGNVRSLARALERAGAAVSISDDPAAVARADRVVIPGQGAFGQAMTRLSERGLVDVLRAKIRGGAPVLGVCLGLQILFERSEEAPGVEGLGVIAGDVKLLPLTPGIKRPHMGWSIVQVENTHPILSVMASREAFYFVHSYAAREAPGFDVAFTEHGTRFVSALARGPLVATQFHPEKSQTAGARLLAAWLRA